MCYNIKIESILYYIRRKKMCVYIGIEDIAANALIELVEKSNKKEVLFSQLNQYGAEIVNIIGDKQKIILIISNESTNRFLNNYSEFFELFSNGNEEGIRLKDGVTVDKLWMTFRTYLTLDFLKAFSSPESLKALGIK